MFPTVVTSEVQRALLDYLRTTFRLADKELEEALFRFLKDEQTGMFRGPYLDVRLPFRKAPEDWEARSPLDFGPPFLPHAHQLRAFERLSARDRQPQNTLVTTGTGSGKTECFLYPVLDHCRRARQRGEGGVKAIILYPMNALATDQAERLAKLLQRPELAGVTAGLYVGGQGQHGSSSGTLLVDDRKVLRKSPPDILLTNYRMLDFLLMRPEDAQLWNQNDPTTLRYLVLDELHTYDGAQGSDVACLIRRLKARLGTPPGHLCCVGTSATIGSGGTRDPRQLLAEFATKIFAEPFTPECLVGEDRASVDEVLGKGSSRIESSLPVPSEDRWRELEPTHYSRYEDYLAAQERLWCGHKQLGPSFLAETLRAHPFLPKLLRGLAGRERRAGPRHWREVADSIAAEDSQFADLSRERQWLLLASFVSLIARARTPLSPDSSTPGPFLQVQVQLWIRELHDLVRLVTTDGVRFAWRDELPPGEGRWLPLLYCRECGFGGLAALQRESEPQLRDALREIGEAFLNSTNRGRVVELLPKTAPAPLSDLGQATLIRKHLCPKCLEVGLEEQCRCAQGGQTLPVRVHPELNESGKPHPLRRCPSCQADDGLSFLASRAATLSSVAISELFASRYNTDPKLLAFTDSVQDASHRAGFFAARTFRFTMRTAIQALVEAHAGPVPLSEFAARLIDHWAARQGGLGEAAALLLPPDLNEDPAYRAYFGLDRGAPPSKAPKPTTRRAVALRELLETRLGWEVTREFGLAVTFGRSLDDTACSTLAVDEVALGSAARELLEHLREHHRGSFRADPDLHRVQHFLEGLLQRLRLKGGIHHPLLEEFARRDSRFFLSKAKNPRLSRFGPHSQVPAFWYLGDPGPRSSYQALHSSPRTRTWYRVWTRRALGLLQENDGSIDTLLDRTVRVLREHGILRTLEGPKAKTVAGLAPEALWVTGDVARVRCASCGHQLTLAAPAAERFVGKSCMAFACSSGAYALDATSGESERYYQNLYKSGRATRIYTGEHTGLLQRAEREALERSFKERDRPDAPNLLTCTPTLEMGIDIGDLSSVMLCSVPPLPSNYVQRVGRAGRSTGNALVLTMANNRRPHDRYFYEEPYEMLRGEIAPPGCFLDAPEMLLRQLLAYALDCWAKEHGSSDVRLPAQMRLLRVDAEDTFPGHFWKFYQEHKARITEQFLELFGDEISPANADHLRLRSNGAGLAGPMKTAFTAVKEQIKRYGEELKKIGQRISALEEDPTLASPVLDETSGEMRPDAAAEIEELEDARRGYRRLQLELMMKYPLNVLADEGIIPNYAFPEPGVTLSALLKEPFDEEAGKIRKGQRRPVEYVRSASQALREFAPFNTFYAEGHKLRISQVDLGSRASALESWRICALCHYMELAPLQVAPSRTCPRCGDTRWPDVGQRRTLVRFRRALSVVDRVAASTAEDSEERDSESYGAAELIDVGPENWSGARLVQKPELVFGFELLQRQLLREINYGRRFDTAKPSPLAGSDVAQRGFLVCKLCGKVSESEAKAQHTPLCGVRRKNDSPEFERIFLYREFRSEAIRLLLPISQLEDQGLLLSMKAALFLGFRKKFLGHPDHLAITTLREPRNGEIRQFLIVYDTVPGGTGYLAELWKRDGLLEVLRLALDAMQGCRCVEDPSRDGCYRCVYAYQQSHEIPHISRSKAAEMLEAILAAARELTTVETLSTVDVGDLTESELERKFLRALQERCAAPGHGWTPIQHQGKACHTFTTPNSEWLVEPQVDVGLESGVAIPSRPDFVLRCLSSTDELPVAVFCDGLKYHVCPDEDRSRLGDDVLKRRALLDSGRFRVWSITWKDLEHDGAPTTLLTRVQRGLYERFFGKDAGRRWRRDDTLRSQTSWQLLWEYLEHPDEAVWRDAAIGFAAGMLSFEPPWSRDSILARQEHLRHGVPRVDGELEAADLTGGPPARFAGLDARPHATFLYQSPASALRSGRIDRGELTLRLFDDAAARARDDFEDSWRAFLHAWNLLQFHPRGLEVVSTEYLQELGEHEAASHETSSPAPGSPLQPGSAAALEVGTRGSSAHPPSTRTSSTRPQGRPRAAATEPPDAGDAYDAFAAEYRDEPHLAELAGLLRDAGLPLPTDAGECDLPIDLEALLLWPDAKVVLVPEPTDADRRAWQERGFVALAYDAPATETLRALQDSPSANPARGAQPRD